MRPALAYVPGRSPLHRAAPWIAVAYLGSLAIVAFVFSNPLVLLGDGIAVAVAGLLAGARRALAASLRFAAGLMVVMVVVNALVNHRGDTILVRGWNLPVIGGTDITLESLAMGGVIGLRIVVVVLAFAVYSACVDPDRVMRTLRPLAHRSAMTAALVTRMVPVAAADLARMREAAALRGPAAEPVGRGALARRLVEGSLDRTTDVAATLELRGHSLGIPVKRRRERGEPAVALLLATLAIVAATAVALATGAGGFDDYPDISIAIDWPTIAFSAALPLLAALPFATAAIMRSR